MAAAGARPPPAEPSGGLLDPQHAPAGRRDLAVDHLAGIGDDEEIAAVALLAVFRLGLIFRGGLRHLRLSAARHQRQRRRSARRADKNRTAAHSLSTFAHNRLFHWIATAPGLTAPVRVPGQRPRAAAKRRAPSIRQNVELGWTTL